MAGAAADDGEQALARSALVRARTERALTQLTAAQTRLEALEGTAYRAQIFSQQAARRVADILQEHLVRMGNRAPAP